MKFQEAVETCLTKKYAEFEGMATRSEFWWFALFCWVVNVILHLVSWKLGTLAWLGLLVPQLAAGARRLRDTGRDPLLLLLLFIPVIGWIALLVFYVQEGQSPTTPT